MFLSDRDIIEAVRLGTLHIDPFDPSHVNPATKVQSASIDLTLDDRLGVIKPNRFDRVSDGEVDPRLPVEYDEIIIPEDGRLIGSLQFRLASTIERIGLSPGLIGRLEGKSSLGRLGLAAHITAGFFDPGFDGYATLELFNAETYPVRLYPGMKICQMSFAMLKTPALRPYGHPDLDSKYQHQGRGPQGSRMHRNFQTGEHVPTS